MKTYLITGGAGFIGSNFIRYILKKLNEEVFLINFDKVTYAGNLDNLRERESLKNYRFIKGDICDREAIEEIFNNYDIDYVINFAAESHVDRSIEDPSIFIKTNVLGTQTLLEVTKKYWATNNGSSKGKNTFKFLQMKYMDR